MSIAFDEPDYPCPWCNAKEPDQHSSWCSASGERCKYCLRPLGFDHRFDCPAFDGDDPDNYEWQNQ